MLGEYWLRVAVERALVWHERVPSNSNLADGPSRGSLQLMEKMGATRSRPLGLHVWPDLHLVEPLDWFQGPGLG